MTHILDRSEQGRIDALRAAHEKHLARKAAQKAVWQRRVRGYTR